MSPRIADVVLQLYRRLADLRFVRFLFVGALNTAFGYALFAFLIFIGLHYAVAVLVGTILGVLFNFKTIGHLVFRNPDNRLILKFFGVYGVTYVLNVAALTLFERFAISMYLAGAILVLPMALVSFALNNHFVFRVRAPESSS